MSSRKNIDHARDLISLECLDFFERWIDICDDVKIVDSNCNSILHHAAEMGNEKALLMLLNVGMDIEARNDQMETPLLYAAARAVNPLPVLQSLRARGASDRCRNIKGQTVYDILISRKLDDIAVMLHDLEKGNAFVDSTYLAPAEAEKGNSSATKVWPVAKDYPTPSVELKQSQLPGNGALSSGHSKLAGRSLHVSFEDEKRSSPLFRLVEESPKTSNVGFGAPPEEANRTDPPQPVAHASIEKELLMVQLEEADARALLVSAFWEELNSLYLNMINGLYKIVNPFLHKRHFVSSFTKSGMAVEVKILGRRHDADGNVLLLASFRERCGTGKSTFEDFDNSYGGTLRFSSAIWVPLENISHFEEVQRYLAQMEESFPQYCGSSNTYGTAGFNSMEDSDYGVKGLDEEERNALEQELRRLPKRYCGSNQDNLNNAQSIGSSIQKELPPLLDVQIDEKEEDDGQVSVVYPRPFPFPRRPEARGSILIPNAAGASGFSGNPESLPSSMGPGRKVRKAAVAGWLPLKGANTLPTRSGGETEKVLATNYHHFQPSHTSTRTSIDKPPPRLMTAQPRQANTSGEGFSCSKLSDCDDKNEQGISRPMPPPRGIGERLELKNYRLSDTQRLQYEKFLYRSAVTALQKQKFHNS